MKHYERLLKMGCFTSNELYAVVGNKKAAESLALSYQKKRYIQSVNAAYMWRWTWRLKNRL